MNDFDRYPEFMSTMLGLPSWAVYLRPLNSLNSLAAFSLAVFVGFSESLLAGIVYAAIYVGGSFIVKVGGSFLAELDLMLISIVLSTIVLVAINVLLALHFLEVWSLISLF